MQKILLFNSREELLRMDIGKIVYFEADGNYTRIVSLNKLKTTIAASLTKTEEALTAQLGPDASQFMRIGKRFIINFQYVYSINLAKQVLILSDQEHFAFQLPVSKDALKRMKEIMVKSK